jgi:TPR repeat protein/uncharacterized membrane protein YhaH (DUF805 family)
MDRPAFWLKTLFPSAILILLISLLPTDMSFRDVVAFTGFSLVFWLLTAGLAKRLHDRDHAGSFQLLFVLPVSGLFVSWQVFGNHPWIAAWGFAAGVIGVWIFVEAGFIRGSLGHNRFGEDPMLYRTSRGPSDIKWQPKADEAVPAGGQTAPPDPAENLASHDQNLVTPSSSIEKSGTFLDDWLTGDEPEIIRSTASTFDHFNNQETVEKNRPDPTRQADFERDKPPRPKFKIGEPPKPPPPSSMPPPITDLDLAATPKDAGPINKKVDLPGPSAVTLKPAVDRSQPSEPTGYPETDRFLVKLREHATDKPAHLHYLQTVAQQGDSWAKLEVAASWLSAANVTQTKADQAISYLRDLADARQSYLGVENEACYFLAEIYRIGLRFVKSNEDLSQKYYIRAVALGHKDAASALASLISNSDFDDINSIAHRLLETAVSDNETASALLQLFDIDWSITYFDSVPIFLRSMVDQGNVLAAKHLGRLLLDQGEVEQGAHILARADQIDTQTIDKIMTIVNDGGAEDDVVNNLISLIQRQAEQGNSYAHYQMGLAYNHGLGVPQDDLMAYVHINVTAAHVYGRERDDLVDLRDRLKENLSSADISRANEILRLKYQI